MKPPGVLRFLLAMLLIAGLGASPAGAAEKIQFSSGNKDKDSKKNSLVIQANKPALQTLDFTRMGGRGSKAEEMAPIAQPMLQDEEPLDDKEKKKGKEKDWQLFTEKDPAESEDPAETEKLENKADNNFEREKDGKKGQSNRNDPKSREKASKQQKSYEANKQANEPKNDRFDQSFNRSGSTNRIMFGTANRQNEQLFQAERAPGSPMVDRGLPSGTGPNTLAEPSRSETLRVLGIEKNTLSGSSQGPANSPSALGNWESSSGNSRQAVASPLESLGNRPAGSAFDQPRNFSGGDTGFKSGLSGDMNPAGFAPGTRGPAISEAPKYERKPAVLPVPQRKF